jgi:glycerophosphoryl diester phosphodiesterase
MQLISHRWLDSLNKEFLYTESSKEAFENLIERWFWLEFDINFSKDLVPFVFHDSWLNRILNWKDNRRFSDIEWVDIENYELPNECHFVSLEDLFKLIIKKQKVWIQSALHLKSKFQIKELLDILVEYIGRCPNIIQKLFIFDVKVDTAKYLKDKLSGIQLFFSVSHKYDKDRFNDSVWWTLYTVEESIENKDLIGWVRLDEWDRQNRDWTKKLYTTEVINEFKSLWLKTAIISPELHAKSPWLLWWESHEDVETEEKLKERTKEIKSLNPDFICSDYLVYYL